MRIITPKGKLYEVFKVEPYVEKKEDFNGTVTCYNEPATSMSMRPTGLECSLKDNQNSFCSPSVYVGNLPTEKVQEIIRVLLKDGYYDFSEMEYQKASIFDCKKLKIDGGTSLPYYNESIFDSTPFSNIRSCVPCFDDEVCSDENGDCFGDGLFSDEGRD